MKKFNLIFIFFMAMFFVSCYEDKGNYDYKDISRMEITFDDYYIETALDEVVEVKPIYSINIDKNIDNYEFKWTLDGETREDWNQKDFTWLVDKVKSDMTLVLEVKDKKNDVAYYGKTTLNVTGLYENSYSWMILSDKDGESVLSFLAVIETISDEAEQPSGSEQLHYKKERFISNVFDGSLGRGPIALQEHFREEIDWGEQIVGNVCVFQESGAVDLEGVGFTKEIDMVDAFVDNKYPNGTIYPGSFLDAVDVVLDKDGKMYSRLKLSTMVYNSEYFMQEPMTFEGEVLEQCRVCRGFYKENRFGYQVIYDGKNRRFLYIQDQREVWGSVAGAAKILKVNVSEDLTGNFVPLDDHGGYELLHVSQFATGDTYDYGFYEVLRSETDNKLYLQHFVSHATWSSSRIVNEIKKTEISGLPAMPDKIAFPIYEPQESAFFAIGNVLYRLDLSVMSPVEVYYTFDSDITAISYDSVNNRHLAVGLEDGSFYVLGAYHAKNIKEEHKVIYKAPEKVGKVVDIEYKYNSGWNY